MMNITMKKSNRDMVCFTDFQELVYLHSIGEITRKYTQMIVLPEFAEIVRSNKENFIQEIIDKDEVFIFKEFRWYKNSQELEAYVPKSAILGFLFWVDQFFYNLIDRRLVNRFHQSVQLKLF